jgi:hypothetical protein
VTTRAKLFAAAWLGRTQRARGVPGGNESRAARRARRLRLRELRLDQRRAELAPVD